MGVAASHEAQAIAVGAGNAVVLFAVMAAVMFLGEDFYLINALGLGVLIMGVFWFNYLKYKKVAAGEIKASKSADLEPYKDEGIPNTVDRLLLHTSSGGKACTTRTAGLQQANHQQAT